MTFRSTEEYRDYYRSECRGDTGGISRADSYEAPRVEWLIAGCKGSVIDVGSCTGDLAAHLQGLGFAVTGIEPSIEHVRISRARYPELQVLAAFAEDVQIAPADTVVCGDVLEHVPDDTTFLRKLTALGSRVLLTTPLGFWNCPEHLRDYTFEMATALVKPHGGSVTVIKDRDGYDRWLGLCVEGSTVEPRASQ